MVAAAAFDVQIHIKYSSGGNGKILKCFKLESSGNTSHHSPAARPSDFKYHTRYKLIAKSVHCAKMSMIQYEADLMIFTGLNIEI